MWPYNWKKCALLTLMERYSNYSGCTLHMSFQDLGVLCFLMLYRRFWLCHTVQMNRKGGTGGGIIWRVTRTWLLLGIAVKTSCSWGWVGWLLPWLLRNATFFFIGTKFLASTAVAWLGSHIRSLLLQVTWAHGLSLRVKVPAENIVHWRHVYALTLNDKNKSFPSTKCKRQACDFCFEDCLSTSDVYLQLPFR